MKIINYILNGFGFLHIQDFCKSTFGFAYSSLSVVKWDLLISFILSTIPFLFGFNYLFLYAFFFLCIIEWWTGIKASFFRGEKHQSRKFGRMLVKIATYVVLIHLLNVFKNNMDFPEVSGFEFDPFLWMYWAVLVAIIWQLLVSILENLDVLGVRGASIILKIINRKFYKQFDLDDNNNVDNAA